MRTGMGMSVLFNLSFVQNQPTGTAVYGLNLLRHLNIPNIQVTSPNQIDHYACHITNKTLATSFGLSGHFKRLLWLNSQLPNIYSKSQANLFFSPVPEAPFCSNIPFVVTIHDLIPLRFASTRSPSNLYFRYYVPSLLKKASCIICNSTSTAQDVLQFYRIPEEKIHPILLGYDQRYFKPLDLPTQNYFLYLGRHNPHKNLRSLITAFSRFPDQAVELWLAGPTDRRYTPDLRNHIQALGLCDRVKILNFVPYDELPTLFSQAIAFVFPSLWEGFGLPVLEALACGTPVITSNISALPEVVGDAAIFVNPYCTAEITDAMKLVYDNQPLRSSLKKQGLARAQKFSWEQTGAMTAKILERYS